MSIGRTIGAPLPPMLALVVLAVLLSLRALAYASPPDPAWIAGIYDGKDGDEVVARIAGRAGAEGAVIRFGFPALSPDRLPTPRLADYRHRGAATQARGPPDLPLPSTSPAVPARPMARGRRRPTRTLATRRASPAALRYPHGPLHARGPPPRPSRSLAGSWEAVRLTLSRRLE